MAQPILHLKNIHKRFGPVHALGGVDLVVYPGEVHALGRRTRIQELHKQLRLGEGCRLAARRRQQTHHATSQQSPSQLHDPR